MFTFLGFLCLVSSFYYMGREATKVEIEYRCKEHKTIELATAEYECKNKIRTLDWVKKRKGK